MGRREDHGNIVISQPRCQIAKTILDKVCEKPGEVRYGGMLLCGLHAGLPGLELRAEGMR
jgi:hypothetical protein